MVQPSEIRLLQPRDLPAMLSLYAPYVEHTAISFEYEIPSLSAFEERMSKIAARYPCLVCLADNTLAGYAYASEFRYRSAYKWSAESTIYMSETFQRRGLGKKLYQTLMDVLRLQGYYNVFAGVALPNEKSERLHRALGFEEIGTYRDIGYKLGKWHSTLWFQLSLADHILEPSDPKGISALSETESFQALLEKASRELQVLLSGR